MSETELTLEQGISLHKKTHENPNVFVGFSLQTFIAEITYLIQHSNVCSVLDYGCGKARAWQTYNLQKMWNLQHVDLYDPAVSEYSKKPQRPSDLVLCVDVLEHIPESALDQVLDELAFFTNKILFVNISTRPANKQLPNGMNAHLNVKSKDWWQKKLQQMDVFVISRFS